MAFTLYAALPTLPRLHYPATPANRLRAAVDVGSRHAAREKIPFGGDGLYSRALLALAQ